MRARSPKARQYERLAAESRERAHQTVGEVRAYILSQADFYERRARETQRKADQRAAKRAAKEREA